MPTLFRSTIYIFFIVIIGCIYMYKCSMHPTKQGRFQRFTLNYLVILQRRKIELTSLFYFFFLKFIFRSHLFIIGNIKFTFKINKFGSNFILKKYFKKRKLYKHNENEGSQYTCLMPKTTYNENEVSRIEHLFQVTSMSS